MGATVNAEEFNGLLSKFKQEYGDRTLILKEHTTKLEAILKDGLKTGLFRAIPITWRMKHLESAIDSVKSRQDARMKRQDLKSRLELQGKSWEHYWTKRDMVQRIDDVGPFKDCKTIFDSLPDIGGARVCVYFPNDVEKVVSFLKGHEQIEVVRVLSRGQGTAPEMIELQNYVEELEQKKLEPKLRNDASNESLATKPMFSGYRATHVHVKLIGKGIPGGYESSRYQNVVEVQIATVVMHAWSQIEHDIIYKPAGVRPSDEERLILDTFNGIVMTGESALRQLAESTDRKENSHALAADLPAPDFYGLGKWLTKYCQEKDVFFRRRSVGWNKLVQMFEILEAADEHNSGEVQGLFKNLLLDKGPDSKVFNQNLPIFLLREKCKQERPNPQESIAHMLVGVQKKQTTAVSARIGALRVIHSLNMASYLGIEEEFLKYVKKILPKMSNCPSLIDFLDLVHPTHPRLNQAAEDSIIEFCDAFLNTDKLRNFAKDDYKLALIELPILLSDIGRVVCRRCDTIPQSTEMITTVPRSLCALLNDSEHTHWIPEIFFAATAITPDIWNGLLRANFGEVLRITGLGSSPELFLLNQNSTHLMLSILKCLLGIPTCKLAQQTSELQVLGGLRTSWQKATDIQIHGSGETCFHLEKQGSLPKFHPGYFEPTSHDTSAPTWQWTGSVSVDWKVEVVDIFNGKSGRDIKKFRRESELLDFAKCLNPEGDFKLDSVLEDTSKVYTFKAGYAQSFKLISKETEFILQKVVKDNKEELEQEMDAGCQTDELRNEPPEQVMTNERVGSK